jgi:hypothetical protein
MFKCENHPNRKAEWFRDSFLPSANAVPICYECRHNYITLNLDKALNIRPIFNSPQKIECVHTG